ncbi:HPr family phosphocarrier protein [Brachyspira sp. SAP_772]|uniref:HPr family phosphocarrier protein n=1 Tax=Brachyspira sp. SAP_772 TaxID=2608385 RepID=UPI0012F4DF0C|nr:HPr family phosphocarrier protein [Brachyspira sp. SAP_772]
MESFKYVINNTNNIHARPLSELAKIAKDSECDVIIIKDDISKDIKKMIGIMQLGLKVGDEVVVNITGENKSKENKAKKNILNFFKTNF